MENVIIIGGGPAGLSAAIYLARADLKPLVFAGSPPGGQLTLTSEVENYPGFESILGSELIEKMRNQAKKFGAKIMDENVQKIDLTKSTHKIYLTGKEYESRSVIIATGAKALWLNLPSETRLRGKGVSACATCDGFFFRGKTVAVVGGGDTALEEALTLTKFAKKVYIIHRRDFFRASKIMQERVLKNKHIEIIWNSTVEEILGEKKVEGIKIKDLKLGIKDLLVDGVFVAIGHKPDTDLFKGHVELDEKGYIKILERRKTSVKGVYVAGDCADPYYRQAITSAGTGVEAALEVERYLES
ncbi:thioredoxin-disulfide reductase [Candidatus Microgenomates bacterium]|nr:MAG: thioredoxin-disulfide reductase [Candidatus Microgenomates bacterium]